MTKKLAARIEEKKKEHFQEVIYKLILPFAVLLVFLIAMVITNWTRIFPPPPPPPTPTATFTATYTITPSSTPTATFTPTVTPTPTPMPIFVTINWNRIAVYELPQTNSKVISGGFLPNGTDYKLVRYCGHYWVLVQFAYQYGNYGWIYVDTKDPNF